MHAVGGDLAAPETPDALVAAALEHFGGLDLLVNNAGAIHPARDLVDFTPEDWREVIEINLVAPAMLKRAAIPAMRNAGRGHIINVSSIGGRKGGPTAKPLWFQCQACQHRVDERISDFRSRTWLPGDMIKDTILVAQYCSRSAAPLWTCVSMAPAPETPFAKASMMTLSVSR